VRWTSPFAVALLVLATIVAGCGGDEDSDDEGNTTISTSSISKADFAKQVNAICKPAQRRLLNAVVAYQEKHLDEASEKVVPDTGRKVIRPEVERQIDAIRRLGAPSGDAGEIERFFAALRKGIDEIIKKKPTTFDQAEGLLLAASADANRYGLDQCKYVLVDESFSARVRRSG
jgi:hypothetical protein